MSVKATYVIELDTQRDGNFAHDYDDITAYVLSANWNLGMFDSYDRMANAAQCTLTLDNVGGEFRQENVGAERVVNGNFAAWSGDNPTGWTVTGESGSDPYVNEVGGGEGNGGTGTGLANLYTTANALSIAQTILTPGERYVCEFDIDGVYGLGGVVVKSGTTAVSPVYHLGGHKKFYFYADSTSFVIAADNGNGTVDVTIDNVSVKQVDRYAGALNNGTLIRVRTTSPVAATLFIGAINNSEPPAGSYSRRIHTLVAQDAMFHLSRVEFAPTLMTDVTADTAIDEIFDKGVIPWPYAHNYWLLEVEGCSELGTTTTLYDHAATAFDTGNTTFDFTGDNLDRGGGVSALSFIRDLMDAELGRFFYDPRGNAYTLHNRHRDMLNVTSVATLTDADWEVDGTQYGTFNDLVNHALVNYQPRTVGAAGTVLWEAGNTITIPARSERDLIVRYRDTENPSARVGAQDVITPVPGVDYDAVSQLGEVTVTAISFITTALPATVTTSSAHGFSTGDTVIIRGVKGMKHVNGTHTITVTSTTAFQLSSATVVAGAYEKGGTVQRRVNSLNNRFTVAIEKGAASSRLTLINSHGAALFLPSFQLRGTPLTVFDKRIAEARNGDSVRDYWEVPRTYDVPGITDEDYARQFANWHIYKFRDPLPYFKHLTFNANKTAERMSNALSREIGHRITVTDGFTGHNSDYFIVGFRYMVTMGGDNTTDVSLVLKPAERERFWILETAGYSELNDTTRLGL